MKTPDTTPYEPRDMSWLRKSFRPFQKATVRGLAVVLPPLLTIVLFIWAWNTIDRFILAPSEAIARDAIVLSIKDIVSNEEIQKQIASGNAEMASAPGALPLVCQRNNGIRYVLVHTSWIPKDIYDFVQASPKVAQPTTAQDYYQQFVRMRYLQRQYVIPAFLALFIGLLYLFGKLFAVGIGRMLWNYLEGLINRIPIIRNVYSSVKQVTDFAFSENEIQFTRVIAVEYPRKGIWSMGFVTGEGMAAVSLAAGEPVVSVLMPTSPMPATGFTIIVPKSQTIDLNMTVDQAIQFCVSCGVVIPPSQQNRNRTVAIPPISGRPFALPEINQTTES